MERLGEYNSRVVGIPEFRVVLPSPRHRGLNAAPDLFKTWNVALSAATRKASYLCLLLLDCKIQQLVKPS